MSNSKQLKKQLGLFDIFAISTGAMFSAGFFLLPGLAAAQTGQSVYLAYLVSGLLIIPAMLSVAELSTAMPKAGGAYYFLDRSLGPMMGTIGGLGSWIALMFKSAFALIGMGAYLSLYVDMSFTMLALILTIAFGVINIFGAKETTRLQRILVATLVGIMIFFTIEGLSSISVSGIQGNGESFQDFFLNDVHGFLYTVGLVFVSFAGLTNVASVAEEVRNPDRNIPMGMIFSLIAAILIYVFGVFIIIMMLEPSVLHASLTPVADAGAVFMSWLPGSSGVIAVVVAAVAAFASTGNAGIMAASRYPFAMSRDKLVSPRLGKVGSTGTPTLSILVTVGCMILILLVFDVEGVAKLASAFQLLLFGLLCFAVIVMRESKIPTYVPGFRSPFYPWVQLAGMLISVWLIAEMGLLAVAFTGMIIVGCVVWYYYYAGKQVLRQGAIFHVHERLGRKRYEALEYELLSILSEKEGEKRLAYEKVIARSVLVDVEDTHATLSGIIDEGADILAGRLRLDKVRIANDLNENYQYRLTDLGSGFKICYLGYKEVEAPELVIFRLKEPVQDENLNKEGNLHAVALLITPAKASGLDMRLIGHLAEIVMAPTFLRRWKEASSEKQLRETLMSDEHYLHVTVDDHPFFSGQIGRRIAEISLPGQCLITILYRYGELIIPHGNTQLEPGDELSVIGNPEDIRWLMDYTFQHQKSLQTQK